MDLPDSVILGAIIISAPLWARVGWRIWEEHSETWREKMKEVREALEEGAEQWGAKRPKVRVDENREDTHPFGGR